MPPGFLRSLQLESFYQRKFRRPMSSERVDMIINSLGVETLGGSNVMGYV